MVEEGESRGKKDMEIRSEYGGNQHGEEMEPEENLEDLEKRDRKNMFSEKDVNGAKKFDL